MAFGCAQQVGPSGGPKDTAPPKIVESEPENFSTGFKGNKIKLRFDEFVQLKDLGAKLIISPPLKETPEFRIKGKTLELSFKDTLHLNTTYNFQFGDGIVDITEGNPLDSNLFVFSTGSRLDSLFVRGSVKKAFNLVPEKQIMVMLYRDFNDSLPYLSRPLYFAKTKDDGSFSIQYLKEGKYKIFALKDGNGNYFFDLPDEPVGFTGNPVSAGDSAEIEILLFEEDITKQFLKRGYAEHFGKIIFAFNKPAEKAKAVSLNRSLKKDWYIEELSEKKDTLTYWLTGTEKVDTLQMQVWDGTEILDTVEIILPEKEARPSGKMKGGKGGFPEKLTLNTNVAQPFDLFKPLQMEAIHPVKSFDFSKIILTEKNDTIKAKPESVGKAMRKFEIRYPWKESTEYSLLIPSGTFTDIYGLQNDTLSITYRTRKKDEYGTINLKMEFDSPAAGNQYIIQLLDKFENLVQEKISTNGTAVKFGKVVVGEYRIKLIYDRNKNSKWDTGNYLKNLQPEKVIYYSSKVELRPRFDLDVAWKINVK